MTATLIGTPVNRIDGRQKVTGKAQYAAEFPLAETCHAVLVGSAIPGGRIRHLDATAAERAPGVHLVLTHLNTGRFGDMPDDFAQGGTTAEKRPPLADARILHTGQYVAMVVADTIEQARYAASLLEIDYDAGHFAVALEDAAETRYQPDNFMGDPLTFERGHVAAGLGAADVKIDATYVTATEHPCALEPHATIATWSGDTLTVYSSTQWVMGDRVVLAAAFRLAPEKVKVICPFIGGMFGSKAATGAHVILAALASQRLGRPVKIVLSRTQVLTDVGHRSETVQRIEIGAKHDGHLTALRHQVTTHTALDDDFTEPATITSRMLYTADHYASRQDVIRLNVIRPAWMRAPGEAPGQFALECAMDELAVKLGMDPLELRRRNHADVNQHLNKPFSSKHLLDCYQRGAQRFGWSRRNPRPGSMRDRDTLIGYGMATATYPGYLMGATVRVRWEQTPSGPRAIVATAGSDVGTGMYTMLAITVAETLGLPLERVTVELGSSELPPCAVAGGSNLTASTAPAAATAAAKIKQQLAASPNAQFLEAAETTSPIFGQNDKFAFQSFGATFVEVRVQPEIGRVRVSRVVSVFDCGRILSAKTTRSQFMGGIVFGIGAALLEELVYDREHGQPVNADLAGYLVAVHADVPEMDISWIDEPDYNFNSMGCRGVGEIGITGVAAAIANAVYNATGVRVRELPITPDKLLVG
jgi:xanthine dehydrogenase YagR molybdenum-binding subunit